MMSASNIHFEMAERSRALNYGGIGAIHLMGQRLGLVEEIDARLQLLRRHLPYHESDHVLNLAYNALLDGQRLEDIELRRNDEAFLDGLGAQRIPDPTTSGDFTRRFGQDSVLKLMEAINAARQRVWEKQPENFLWQAFVDIDGTLAGTMGECKGGMALSYKGIWGYAPLIITLANTREVLYLVNRPGNVVSHEGCVPWIDRAIELLRPRAGEITLRGDTDFTLSAELDRWDSQGIKFIFGMDAHPKVVQLAESLPETTWKPLERLARYEIATEPRRKPQRIKEAIVRFKGYLNKKLVGECVAEFSYQPNKCGHSYLAVSEWVGRSALGDILKADFSKLNEDRLYGKRGPIEAALCAKEKTLFSLQESILLYHLTCHLTSTYFECLCLSNPKAKLGYSRDSRTDCKQVVVGLVLDGEGFPKAHEIFAGNRSDSTTVADMTAKTGGQN